MRLPEPNGEPGSGVSEPRGVRYGAEGGSGRWEVDLVRGAWFEFVLV